MAAALAKKGCKVGILDADIYGPSVPTMMDVEGYIPKSIKINDQSKIEPIESYNVKIMSIGFFTKLDQAVVWRGPMASKALNQMIFDTHWGELDFLFLDLPPGTGDIHLSLVQSLPITGSIIVSTPQNVALADARRGIKMFQQESISVPILGLIENMAYFKTNDSETKHYIFGEAGVKYLSKDLNINFLGEIPIFKSLREASDFGRPGSLQESSDVSNIFDDISKNVVEQLLIRNKELPPTKIVEITNLVGCSAIKKAMSKLENKILEALEEIRPFLIKDGGDISLESVKHSTVKVKLHGACADCKVNQMTLKNGVETTIKKYAPEIKEVKSVLPLSE